MRTLHLTIKNYRCFADSHPLVIDIGPGFTGLVGVNNSGKSSLLKFFYEFRPFFAALANIDFKMGRREFQPSGAEDWHELFHNDNKRPITIELEDRTAQEGDLLRMSVTMDRGTQRAIVPRFYAVHEGKPVELIEHRGAQAFHFKASNGVITGIEVTTDTFLTFGKSITQALYIGPFRNAINQGAATYFDMEVGTSFIGMWDHWKNGPMRQQNEAIQSVMENIRHIFDFRSFDVNASSDKKTLQVTVDGRSYRLRELGAGLAQFIIVFGNLAIKEPAFLFIDEPEINLHPTLQADFLTSLASYTSIGVMFATHSLGLARSISDRIYTFQKSENHTVTKPFDQTPNFAEFVGEMSFSSFKELGFETILLVEGVTEVKAIQQFLRVFGKDHQVVIIPLGGSQLIRGGVEQELGELSRISKQVAVLIDSERTKESEDLTSQRAQFVADCKKLGFAVHVTERRAFENYLTERAIQSVKGMNYKALGHYDARERAAQIWGKHENWKIAREMNESEVLATDIGAFLQKLG